MSFLRTLQIRRPQRLIKPIHFLCKSIHFALHTEVNFKCHIYICILQLDSSLQDWPFVYMSRWHGRAQLQAIGLGSNKQKCERAERLPITLSALLHGRAGGNDFALGELRAELHLAKQARVVQLLSSDAAQPPGNLAQLYTEAPLDRKASRLWVLGDESSIDSELHV